MTKEEFKSAIEDNDVIARHMTTAEVAKMTPYVHVNLDIDSGTLDYYYSISMEELLDSSIPDDVLDELKDQGWAFDEKKENIIIFLKS
jgi:hypothetical protein